MDEELLKKILSAGGVKDITPDILKAATQAAQSNPLASSASSAGASSTDAIKTGLTRPSRDPADENQLKLARAEESLASRRANRPDVFVKDNKTAALLNNIDDARDRKEIFSELGIKDPQADEYAPYLDKDKAAILGDRPESSSNRLDAYKASQKAPQATAEQRKAELDGVRLPISDNIKNGLTGRDVFKDRDGKIEDPKQLKERMLKEGSDMDTASRAAGQRYRDMFGGNDRAGYEGGDRGAQDAAIRNADPKDRMSIMKGLKEARVGMLQDITERRNADPNRKPVGTEMAIISGQTGEVLMKRGEGEARVARGGLQGAIGGTEDVLGKMELTPAGENAIRDRVTVNKTADGATAVTGRYGTGVSGPKSTVDQMKERGLIAKDFQLTSEQKTGQAPLPKEFADARTKMLADAGQTAKRDGAVVGDAANLVNRVSAGTVNNIDKRADKIAADLKQQQSDKLGNDFLNAYKASGGKVGTPNPNAPSPGPRTDQEKTAMQGFLNSNDELKRKLARR